MRFTLILIGFAVPIIAIASESNTWHDVPVGYFLVAAASIIAGAFWRTDSRDSAHFDTVQRVAGILASGPLTMDELLGKLAHGAETPEFQHYREGIGFMLMQQMLVIEDGQVALKMSAGR